MSQPLSPALRYFVLGGAFLAATSLAFLQGPRDVHASEPHQAALLRLAQADAAAIQKEAVEAARDAARDAAAAAREAAAAAREAVREAARSSGGGSIDIELPEDSATKDGRQRGIKINVDGIDRQYDSFDAFVEKDPALATMVFGIVFLAFLTPILFTALVIWYKMRKARMTNETMLKLAEKGLVSSPEALDALQSGSPLPAQTLLPATAPLVEQVRAIRQRAAWSDLRKGVIMGAIGLALTVYSISDGEPNWLGLVLLFVGIGYGVLWYFETRNASAPPAAPTAARPGDPVN
jgi:hypothetical protein